MFILAGRYLVWQLVILQGSAKIWLIVTSLVSSIEVIFFINFLALLQLPWLRVAAFVTCFSFLFRAIHLSNNAIQKFYSNGPRSAKLPDENMWDNEEFISYLK